jgi:hypothetical protein
VNAVGSYMMALPSGVVAASVRFHRWRLGFKQSSFCHITRVLRVYTLNAFKYLPLL